MIPKHCNLYNWENLQLGGDVLSQINTWSSRHFGAYLIRQIKGRFHRPNNLSFSGYSYDIIFEIMRTQGVLSLPKVYTDYLTVMGATQDILFLGSDVDYRFLMQAKAEMLESLSDEGIEFNLPSDAFVFFGHQGYQFLYFFTDNEIIDPPVFNYVEARMPHQIYERLSDFYLEHFQLLR